MLRTPIIGILQPSAVDVLATGANTITLRANTLTLKYDIIHPDVTLIATSEMGPPPAGRRIRWDFPLVDGPTIVSPTYTPAYLSRMRNGNRTKINVLNSSQMTLAISHPAKTSFPPVVDTDDCWLVDPGKTLSIEIIKIVDTRFSIACPHVGGDSTPQQVVGGAHPVDTIADNVTSNKLLTSRGAIRTAVITLTLNSGNIRYDAGLRQRCCDLSTEELLNTSNVLVSREAGDAIPGTVRPAMLSALSPGISLYLPTIASLLRGNHTLLEFQTTEMTIHNLTLSDVVLRTRGTTSYKFVPDLFPHTVLAEHTSTLTVPAGRNFVIRMTRMKGTDIRIQHYELYTPAVTDALVHDGDKTRKIAAQTLAAVGNSMTEIMRISQQMGADRLDINNLMDSVGVMGNQVEEQKDAIAEVGRSISVSVPHVPSTHQSCCHMDADCLTVGRDKIILNTKTLNVSVPCIASSGLITNSLTAGPINTDLATRHPSTMLVNGKCTSVDAKVLGCLDVNNVVVQDYIDSDSIRCRKLIPTTIDRCTKIKATTVQSTTMVCQLSKIDTLSAKTISVANMVSDTRSSGDKDVAIMTLVDPVTSHRIRDTDIYRGHYINQTYRECSMKRYYIISSDIASMVDGSLGIIEFTIYNMSLDPCVVTFSNEVETSSIEGGSFITFRGIITPTTNLLTILSPTTC